MVALLGASCRLRRDDRSFCRRAEGAERREAVLCQLDPSQTFRFRVSATETAVTVAEAAVFKGRHFDRSVILLCVRWYLAYNLSLRNLEEMMAERGIEVDHATVGRWVVHYSPVLLERFNRHKRPISRK
jgi:putative transposase